MNKAPLVSILCITYNHAPYIEEALKGFVRQKTTFPFELIIHDDASTDNTAEIIRKYEELYPDIIRPVYQTDNQYSKGVKIGKTFMHPLVRGKYIALCEGDDCWIDDNKLQIQIDFLEKNTDVIACIGGAKVLDYSNKKREYMLFPSEEDRYISMEEAILQGPTYPTATFVFRKSVLYQSNIFDDLNLNFGDYTAVLDFLMKGKVYSFHRVFSLYRYKTPNSWTAKNDSDLSGKKKICDNLILLFQRFNDYTDNAYKSTTDKMIFAHNFQILLMEKNYDELKKEPYSDAYKLYSSLPQRLKRFLSKYFPWTRYVYRLFVKK